MTFLRRHLITIIGCAVSFIAIYLLFESTKPQELGRALGTIRLVDLWPVPLLILSSYVARALRWQLLIEHRTFVGFPSAFIALMIGYLFNTLLPARAGDIARTLQLARSENMSRTKVLTTLVTERVVDFGSMLVLLMAVLLVYPGLPNWLKSTGNLLAFATIMSCLGLAVLHFFGRSKVLSIFQYVIAYFPSTIGDRLERIYMSVLEGISGLFRPRYAIGIFTLTGIIWVVEVAFIYLVSHAAHVDLSIGNALFTLLLLSLASMIPSSPGQIGTYEYFGVAALGLIGVAGPSVLAFILLVHGLTLTGAIFIGLGCFMFRGNFPTGHDDD